MNYIVQKINLKKSALQFTEMTSIMTNINNNIAFKELKRGKITLSIWKKYLNRLIPSSITYICRTILWFSLSNKKYNIHPKYLCNRRSSFKLY